MAIRMAVLRDTAVIQSTATATVTERGKDENDTHRHRSRDARRLQATATRHVRRLGTRATETNRSDDEHVARTTRHARRPDPQDRKSEEHTSELQSRLHI